VALIEYKGYIGAIEIDQEQDIFHGRVVNTRDVITFEGRSTKELRKAFAESVEDYLEMCAEDGVEPNKPFSGEFRVRLDPELHREAVIAAAQARKSLNTFVKEAIKEYVASRR
jgi:predicted HicB family RNase H-like nuclease